MKPPLSAHSVTLNQTITHTIVKQKILFLHRAEGRQACGGTEIRPHPSLEMSYSPPTNNQQVHAARLAGIGPDGVIPSARQRVTSWTEITSPAFKNTLTRGRRGDIESASWRTHPLPSPPLDKKVTEREHYGAVSPCYESLSAWGIWQIKEGTVAASSPAHHPPFITPTHLERVDRSLWRAPFSSQNLSHK